MQALPKTFGLFIAPLFLFASGCETTRTPDPSSTSPRGDVIRAAVDLERQENGREATIGGGESMAPVFGENSVIVTHPIAFKELEVGMMVAFFNEDGIRVVHQLIKLTPNGWVSQGLNNAFPDEGFVTAENLIGEVYGVFQSEAQE